MSLSEPVNGRPKSLLDLANRVVSGQQQFDPAVREFLDHFYADASDRSACIAETPPAVGEIEDAYLAAVAEHLALSYDLLIPPWTEAPSRCLHRPFFAGGVESLKAILIAESPTAFRRRLIFVSADALSRPRTETG